MIDRITTSLRADHLTARTIGIGLCTAESDPCGMPGEATGSCAYYGEDGRLSQAGKVSTAVWPLYRAGDTIGCGFDYRTKEVSYTRNGRHLGMMVSMPLQVEAS